MKPTIGHTPAGERVCVDLRRCQPVFLIADPGAGKTTLARFLLRWWLAMPGHNARISAADPHEYTDLAARRPTTVGSHGGPRRWLTVIDGADALSAPLLRLLLASPGPSVITTTGPVALAVQAGDPDDECTYLGLLPRHRRRSGPGPDPGQGRLDWPVGIVTVVPATRGAHDLPRHRWGNLALDAG